MFMEEFYVRVEWDFFYAEDFYLGKPNDYNERGAYKIPHQFVGKDKY